MAEIKDNGINVINKANAVAFNVKYMEYLNFKVY